MRDDLESWLQWYERYLNIGPDRLCLDYKGLIEMFLTRNVHIHNAGRVNEIYLTSATRLGAEPRRKRIGSELPVNQKYLLWALDILQVTGYGAIFGMLRKLDSKLPKEGRRAEMWFTEAVFALLEDERYDAIIGLTSLVTEINGSLRHVDQVNAWVALKETKGLQAIEDDVRAWDTTDLEPQYRLVQLALLEDYPAAASVADDIFGTAKLSRGDWNGWPVLKGLREWVGEDPDRERFLLRETRSGSADKDAE
jgi:hypothetical protein